MAIDVFKGRYHFLSNFWKVSIPLGDFVYPTVEHAYVAMKSEDPTFRKTVSLMDSPGSAKWLGRRVRPLRANWNEMRIPVMTHLISIKFSTLHPELVEQLLATGDEILSHKNTHNDKFWGMVQNESGEWVGDDHLAKIIMERRNAIAG